MNLEEKLALIPFVKIFAVLLLGILVGMNVPTIFSIGAFVSIFILITLFFLFRDSRTLLSYLLLFALGVALPMLQHKEPIPLNQNIERTLTIIDTTSKKGILICKSKEDHQKIAIIWNHNHELSSGDTLKATIQIENLRFAHYTLKKAINDKNITLSAKVIGEAELIKGNGYNQADKISLLQKINLACSKQLSELNINAENIAIINGMLLGNKEDINKKQIEEYQAAGISHILAISGMHISIIFMILNILFIFKKKSYILRLSGSIGIITILWVYTLMVGSPVSALRATMMFTILQISMIRVFSPLQTFNTLFATATLFLLVDHTLITDLSFQLSFTAILSILLFMPYFTTITKRLPYFVAIIPNIIAVSIAAQILTTPLVLHYFGYFSLVSLPANIVATITITAIIILAISYLIFPNIYCETGIEWAFKILNDSLNYLVKLPHSHIENIGFSKIDVMIYSILILMIVKYLNKYIFRL